MATVRYTQIEEEEAGQRIDNYLLRILKGVPKSHIYRIIRNGEVRVNRKRVQVDYRLVSGDAVRIPPVRTAEKPPEDWSWKLCGPQLQEAILYEDERLLVLNKPAGMAVHGGSGLRFGVIETLRQGFKEIPYLELVHRLDRDTSGCLLIAKKRSMLRALHRLLEARQVEKIYWALLSQPWQGKKKLRVDMALEKNQLQSGERIVRVHEEGKAASTNFQLLENFPQACWVEAKPFSGRTHQIRVHSAWLGHPILWDEKYGDSALVPEKIPSGRKLYLHAREIRFTLEGKNYAFQAPLDAKFEQLLQKFRNKEADEQ